jgi:hypothetical protein
MYSKKADLAFRDYLYEVWCFAKYGVDDESGYSGMCSLICDFWVFGDRSDTSWTHHKRILKEVEGRLRRRVGVWSQGFLFKPYLWEPRRQWLKEQIQRIERVLDIPSVFD